MDGRRTGSPPDILAGLLFLAVASVFGVGALELPMGVPAAMGAGFFPMLLSVLLGTVGIALLLRGVAARQGRAWGSGGVRQAVIVLLAVGLFGVLLEPLGLVVALIVLVGVGRLADAWRGVASIAANALVVLLLVYVVFIRLLGLPVRLWPAF